MITPQGTITSQQSRAISEVYQIVELMCTSDISMEDAAQSLGFNLTEMSQLLGMPLEGMRQIIQQAQEAARLAMSATAARSATTEPAAEPAAEPASTPATEAAPAPAATPVAEPVAQQQMQALANDPHVIKLAEYLGVKPDTISLGIMILIQLYNAPWSNNVKMLSAITAGSIGTGILTKIAVDYRAKVREQMYKKKLEEQKQLFIRIVYLTLFAIFVMWNLVLMYAVLA